MMSNRRAWSELGVGDPVCLSVSQTTENLISSDEDLQGSPKFLHDEHRRIELLRRWVVFCGLLLTLLCFATPLLVR